MNKKLTMGLSFCILLYSSALLADSDMVSSQMENTINAHLTAASKDSESIEDVMKTVHSEAPASMHIKVALEQMFPIFDVNMSIAEFSFVGINGDYAMARVKQKVEKVSGPASLKNHISEQLYVFKQEQNQWKIWHAVALDKEYL